MNFHSRVGAANPETASGPKAFLTNIHTLRALAIAFIVGGHVSAQLRIFDPSPALSALSTLLDDGSVLFVFVAGYLFQHLSAGYRYLPYLRKKFMTVIVPYLLVSIPAVYIAVAWHGANPPYPELVGHSWAYQAAWYYLKGGAHLNCALWFVPMIALYYLAAPAFMAFIKKPQLYALILPLFVLSAVIKRPPFPNLDILHLALYMLPCYLMGMVCSQFGDPVLEVFEHPPWLAWVLCAAAWLLPLSVSGHAGNVQESGYFTFEHGWVDWLFVQKSLMAVLLTVALKHFPVFLHRRLAPLAETSFAIFFVHVYWLFLIVRLAGPALPEGIVGWATVTALVLSLSFMTATVAKAAFPRYSRFLIGYG